MKTFELMKIDPMNDGNSWYWNDCFLLKTYKTAAKDEKRTFLRELHKLGIIFRQGKVKIETDYDYITAYDRWTDEPLFSAKCIEEE